MNQKIYVVQLSSSRYKKIKSSRIQIKGGKYLNYVNVNVNVDLNVNMNANVNENSI